MNKKILFSLILLIPMSSCMPYGENIQTIYERQTELEAKIDKLTETIESDMELMKHDIQRLENNQLLLTEQIDKLERKNTTLKKKLTSVQNEKTVTTRGMTPNESYANADENYQHGKYEDAILDFQRFIDSYPKDKRVPEAYLKQGLALISLGRNKEAKFFFRTLIDKYPNSAEAKTAKNKMRPI